MLITISGPPGSGKSTAAAALADAIDADHVSGGDLFREMAAERDLSLAAFNDLAESDDGEVDRALDRRLLDTARDADHLVLESRLAGWVAGDHADLRIWLDAPLEVRAERIGDREGKPAERARKETRTREASEAQRYEEYYGIDIDDRSIYDLALNTARWGPETVATLLATAASEYDPDADEGMVPVEGVVGVIEN
jgi:cytidylate kinase